MLLLTVDPGTAGFGIAIALTGAGVLVFRARWHALWWRGGAGAAPDDPEFERGVYQWGTVAFGAALVVLGTLLALAGFTSG